MKYYRWLRTFKGLSKRIYGSPLNPVKNMSARGKVGACTLRCVFRESDAVSPHIVGFKFHFVKYFYPASRSEWTLQRRRAHPNKALRKLYAPRGVGTYVYVSSGSHFHFRGFANEKCQRTYSRPYHGISYAKRSIALGSALLILYVVRIPHVRRFRRRFHYLMVYVSLFRA